MLFGQRVTLRPAGAADLPELVRIRATPQVAAQWGDDSPTAEELQDPGKEVFAVLLDGRIVGAIQWYEESDPEYRHAGIDIYLDPAVHGQGLGADAVRTMARHLVTTKSFHRLVIDPAAANAAAIRCYEKVGFRGVGVMRQYWRDPAGVWRDGLLMDLLADELI
ncbi:GNAT family protein [Luedemannella helvata]|uniref:GNAT family protein n=1 Tax=Luedemannella helvata TaxID=349315 RepID=A0ABP4VT46_9ACTN